MMAPYSLFVLENPLLDLQIQSDDEVLLQKYNLRPNDAILAGPEHAPLFQELIALNAIKLAGRGAQNAARGAQFILPPHSVLYVGAVGDDEEANTLRHASAAAGLDTEYMVVPNVPTGKCGAIITGDVRSLVTELGAAKCYDLKHLQSPEIWKHVEAASIYYVGGFHLTVAPDAAERLGQEAAKEGKTSIVNLSAPFIPLAFAQPLEKVISYADIVIGNETEAASWAESQKWSETDREDLPAIAKAICSLRKVGKPGRVTIITQGLEPTLVATDGQVIEYPVRKVDKSMIRDTNGAGDAFAGGFLAGLVEGKDVRTCVEMGQWLASLSIQEVGPSFPERKQAYSPLL